MADIKVEQKSGGQMTWLWAAAAVIAIAAFMFWLYNQSSQIESTVAVEGDTAAADTAAGGAGGAAETAELAAIGQNPDTYAGRTVQVQAVPVAATVGPRAFWGDIPGANPFLVVLGPGVQGVEPASGQTYNVTGTVQQVNEQVLGEWVQSGVITEAARAEASFATHALVAEQATAAQGAAPAQQ